jgi:hypothetical protein
LIALLTSVALASGAFDDANGALAAGDLAAAEAGYRAALAAGDTGGTVWFDLGNVLYREGRLGEAVLAWRIAAARLPRDPDVQANLDFARRQVKDKLDVPDPHPTFAPWQVALTADEGMWLGAGFAGLGLVLLAARRRFPHLPLVGIGATLAAGGAVVGAGGVAEAAMAPVAVVLSDEVTATSDLGGGVDLFALHAGAEVQTVEEAAGKVQILLQDGRRGWVVSDAVGFVDPARFPAR